MHIRNRHRSLSDHSNNWFLKWLFANNWSYKYLYFGDDVCYFDHRILGYSEFTLCIHLTVHPGHAPIHTLLNTGHFLCTQMYVSLILERELTEVKCQCKCQMQFNGFKFYVKRIWLNTVPSVYGDSQTLCRVAVSSPTPQKLSVCPPAPCACPEWADPTSENTHQSNISVLLSLGRLVWHCCCEWNVDWMKTLSASSFSS